VNLQASPHRRLVEQINPKIARSICVPGEGKAGTFGAYMQLNIDGVSPARLYRKLLYGLAVNDTS
jgi:hypothetical protein